MGSGVLVAVGEGCGISVGVLASCVFKAEARLVSVFLTDIVSREKISSSVIFENEKVEQETENNKQIVTNTNNWMFFEFCF